MTLHGGRLSARGSVNNQPLFHGPLCQHAILWDFAAPARGSCEYLYGISALWPKAAS